MNCFYNLSLFVNFSKASKNDILIISCKIKAKTKNSVAKTTLGGVDGLFDQKILASIIVCLGQLLVLLQALYFSETCNLILSNYE